MVMTTQQDLERAKSQARAQLDSIKEMIVNLDSEDSKEVEDAYQAIQEDALSVEVRSEWHEPGAKDELGEYRILLCTGGPAVQIIGDLHDRLSEPETARLQYQDWFTPWTDYPLDSEEEEALLTYARCFWFGE
jgi:hypothetical protein